MIVLFHHLASYIYNFCKKRVNFFGGSSISKSNNRPLAQWNTRKELVFDPPVYRQRYERISQIITDPRWKQRVDKIVDFGCAEFGLFVFLKHSLQKGDFSFVDIDEELLREQVFKLHPLNADYIVKRPGLITVRVYKGSISEPDLSVLDADIVVAIEIIEHLHPDILEGVPYNIFHFIRPKVAIFTTPNCEFNVLFDKVNKFRHYDHKFEWTRDQFESWATNITERFPDYSVTFDGVGEGPEGTTHLGCCTQLALFVRNDACDVNRNAKGDKTVSASYGICSYNSCSVQSGNENGYKLIEEIKYPFTLDTRSEEEKILDEIMYRINSLGYENGRFFDYDENVSRIPVEELMYGKLGQMTTLGQVGQILAKSDVQIEERVNGHEKLETFVIVKPEMANSSSCSDASDYDSDNSNQLYSITKLDKLPESDWGEDVVKQNWDTEDCRQNLNNNTLPPSVPEQGASGSLNVPQDLSDNNRPNRLSTILSVFDNFDKVNELDALRSKDKKFFSFASNLPPKEVMKKICQEIAKHPVAGPSTRKRTAKKPVLSPSDESTEEVKSITTCLLENTLNKIDCEDRNVDNLTTELIQDLRDMEEITTAEPTIPIIIVEDNDTPPPPLPPVMEENDNPQPEPMEISETVVVVDNEEDEGLESDMEVAWSSREVLFDVNSQVDLLDDFDIDTVAVSDIVFPVASNCAELAEVQPAPRENVSGVHPSTVAMNDDDDDDDDDDIIDNGNDTDSSSSSDGTLDVLAAGQDVFLAQQENEEENLLGSNNSSGHDGTFQSANDNSSDDNIGNGGASSNP